MRIAQCVQLENSSEKKRTCKSSILKSNNSGRTYLTMTTRSSCCNLFAISVICYSDSSSLDGDSWHVMHCTNNLLWSLQTCFPQVVQTVLTLRSRYLSHNAHLFARFDIDACKDVENSSDSGSILLIPLYSAIFPSEPLKQAAYLHS